MSFRDDVVSALDGLTVDMGTERPAVVIAALPVVPQSFSAYTAWPVWVSTTFRTACIADERWYVLLTLAAGTPDAWADDGDRLLWPVRDALLKIGGVLTVEPVRLSIGDASQIVPALRYTLNA